MCGGGDLRLRDNTYTTNLNVHTNGFISFDLGQNNNFYLHFKNYASNPNDVIHENFVSNNYANELYLPNGDITINGPNGKLENSIVNDLYIEEYGTLNNVTCNYGTFEICSYEGGIISATNMIWNDSCILLNFIGNNNVEIDGIYYSSTYDYKNDTKVIKEFNISVKNNIISNLPLKNYANFDFFDFYILSGITINNLVNYDVFTIIIDNGILTNLTNYYYHTEVIIGHPDYSEDYANASGYAENLRFYRHGYLIIGCRNC